MSLWVGLDEMIVFQENQNRYQQWHLKNINNKNLGMRYFATMKLELSAAKKSFYYENANANTITTLKRNLDKIQATKRTLDLVQFFSFVNRKSTQK